MEQEGDKQPDGFDAHGMDSRPDEKHTAPNEADEKIHRPLTEATVQPFSIETRDGYTLSASGFVPPGDVKPKTIIINSTAAAPQRFYAAIAKFLATSGFPVITYDYRGVGGSKPSNLRGFEATISDWGRLDFSAVLEWTSAQFPQNQIFVLGHAVGGQLPALAENNHLIDGLITISAQNNFWGNYEKSKGRRRFYSATKLLLPKIVDKYGYLPAKTLNLGEDLPKGVFLEWAQWCQTPGYMFDDENLDAAASAGGLQAPILATIIEDDIWAPEKAVRELMKYYTGAIIDYWPITPRQAGVAELGHLGFFNPEFEILLWPDIARWFSAVKPDTPPQHSQPAEHLPG